MIKCFHPGSNWGPSACEADVITTTLWKLIFGTRAEKKFLPQTLKNVFLSHRTQLSWAKDRFKPLWRNWLARSAVNRKAGGSSPPRGAITQVDVCFVQFLQIDSFLRYFTLLEVLNVMDSILFGLLEEGTLWLQYLSFSWIADIANMSVMLKKKTSYCTLQMFQHKWFLSYVLLPSLGYLQRDRSYRKIVSRMIVKVARMFLFKTHTKIIYIKNRN